eukprot:m51a1_g3534 hypothetical protein (440) ;mRNA; r:956586-958078
MSKVKALVDLSGSRPDCDPGDDLKDIERNLEGAAEHLDESSPAPLPTAIPENEWFQLLTGYSEAQFRLSKPSFVPVADESPALPGHTLELVDQKSGRAWGAGKMSVLSVGELQGMVDKPSASRQKRRPPCTVEFLTGLDWGSLMAHLNVSAQQADPSNAGAVFQVASNFNAVEAPDESANPDDDDFTENYVWDKTQGPAASISAGAAAIARVHAAFFTPDDGDTDGDKDEWRQTHSRQIEMLGLVKSYYTVINGYVVQTGAETPLPEDPASLEALARKIRVVLHSNVQVTFRGGDGELVLVPPPGHLIDQVFCAAVNVGQGASGAQNSHSPQRDGLVRLALQAAYEGTYLSAIVNRRRTLYLTLLGGGAFGNDIEDIFAAIRAAHRKWSGHPASCLERVRVSLWDRELPDEWAQRFKQDGAEVMTTVWDDGECKSAKIP